MNYISSHLVCQQQDPGAFLVVAAAHPRSPAATRSETFVRFAGRPPFTRALPLVDHAGNFQEIRPGVLFKGHKRKKFHRKS
jgi:hypothetical protein